MQKDHLFAMILAGGRGERFWPMGRRNRPKQLLKLTGERTMLELTAARLTPWLAPERVLVTTNVSYLEKMRGLLPLPPENFFGEPVGRDTAPCVAFAAGVAMRRDPEAVTVLLPADHLIAPDAAFQATLLRAAELAGQDYLVTIGIPPTEPATGYGYIQCGAELAPGCHRVERFREKPDLATATEFLRAGNFRWNGGIFVWKSSAIVAEFDRFVPELGDFARAVAASASPQAMLESAAFAALPKISIDYAVMEKSGRVAEFDANFAWNDIGCWSALRDLEPLDGSGNLRRGENVLLDCRDCTVIGDAGRLIGVVGCADLVVVQCGNATLVCPRDRLQQVRNLVRELEKSPENADYL